MKKLLEILEKCAQYEELAALAAEIPIIEHPTVIPRPPRLPTPMSLEPRPSMLAEPTARPAIRPPPMEAEPVARPAINPPPMEGAKPAPTEVAAPKKPSTVLDPKTLQPIPETALDIKFDEHGNVVVPDKWVDAQGKLTVNKRQLAEAIHKARKAKIVRQKLDAAKAKTLARELGQVNRMVNQIAFRERLPLRSAMALLTVSSLAIVYYMFANRKPTTTDPTKAKVIDQSVGAVGNVQRPPPGDLVSSINTLKNSLTSATTKSDKEKQVLQRYVALLNNVNSSLQKLSGNLNLDSTQAATAYAAEIQNFDKLAVDTISKLERLENALKAQGDTDLSQKVNQVRFDLEMYIVDIESARTVKNQGTSP